MAGELFLALTLLTALGCGLIGGTFFAFSAFVMKALARLPPAGGSAAMQSINVVVLGFRFMAAFFGTALGSLVLLIVALVRWGEPEAAYLLAGGVLYLAGTFGVTVAFNVPRNTALAAAEPGSPEGSALWDRYVREWTAWNTARTVAAVGALAAFIGALVVS